MRFGEFVGNDNVIFDLSEAADRRTLPHAILIDGAKGTGKRTLAGIISLCAVCTAESGKPCGNCPGCRKALHGYHPDITILNGENSGELSVDSIRTVRSDAYIKPNEAPMKAYVLQSCDRMLAPAQNAFLKVLEEPPPNVMFIMTVTSANMLLQTIRSRTRLYSLYPVETDAAVRYISANNPGYQYEEIEDCVKASSGNIGQAMELLGSGGEEARSLAREIINTVVTGKEYDLLVLTNRMAKDRAFALRTIDCMSELAALCVKASVGADVGDKTAMEAAKRIPRRRLLILTENIRRARRVISTNVNMNFFCTWLSSVLRV